jgi:hypothetical protein
MLSIDRAQRTLATPNGQEKRNGTMTAELETEQLVTLVHARLQSLQDLLRLTDLQDSVIEAGNMTDLIELLDRKQQILQSLQECDQMLAPFRAQPPDSRVWRDQARRALCRQMTDACEEVLRVLLDRERAAEHALVSKKDGLAEQLSRVNAAAVARQAYQKPSTGSQLQLEG